MKTQNETGKMKVAVMLEIDYDPARLSPEEARQMLVSRASHGAAEAVGWLAGVRRCAAEAKVAEGPRPVCVIDTPGGVFVNNPGNLPLVWRDYTVAGLCLAAKSVASLRKAYGETAKQDDLGVWYIDRGNVWPDGKVASEY